MSDRTGSAGRHLGKAALRAAVRAARAGTEQDIATETGASAVRRALALPELAGAATVAAYLALPDEVPTAPLVDALAARGATVLLPVLRGDGDLAWGRHGGPLRAGRFGLAEPAEPDADLADADVVVVPGVAYDASGARLGRGGGSYDRALARVRPGVPLVALAWDEAIVAAVPTEPHDVRVDVIVTPTRVLRAAPGGGAVAR